METKSGRRAISCDWLARKAKAIPSTLDRKNARVALQLRSDLEAGICVGLTQFQYKQCAVRIMFIYTCTFLMSNTLPLRFSDVII